MNINRPYSPCDLCGVSELGLCQAFDSDKTARLDEIVRRQELGQDQTLFYEKDRAGYFYAITTGAVRLTKMLPDGRRQIIGFLFPGDIAGLDADATYNTTAEAIAPTHVCRFDRHQLQETADQIPDVQRRLTWLASHELALAEDLLMVLGRMSAQEKLAFFLIGLYERAARKGNAGAPVFLPMSRADIADYLGLTIETVSRTFTKLAREGVIEVETAHNVHLKDLGKLKEAAGVFTEEA